MDRERQVYVKNSTLKVSLCFPMLNNSCPKLNFPDIIRLSIYVFCVTTSVLTVIGNFLVIVTVVHFKRLQTPTNYLILSMAVADLLVGGFLMPPFMVQTAETCWYTGHFHCKAHFIISVALCNTSILHLCFIAIDRYFAVCHPLRYQTTITPFVTGVMIFLCWTVSAVVAYGMVSHNFDYGSMESLHRKINCEGSCAMILDGLTTTLLSVLGFYLPGIIMICIYAKIHNIAKKQARSIQDSYHNNRFSGKNCAIKTERKATKTLTIVMGVFLSFWLPFFVSNILDPFIGHSTPILVLQMVSWLGFLNSVCNPIVYCLFYSWFRNAFKMILQGKICNGNSSSVNLQ